VGDANFRKAGKKKRGTFSLGRKKPLGKLKPDVGETHEKERKGESFTSWKKAVPEKSTKKKVGADLINTTKKNYYEREKRGDLPRCF